MSGQTMGHIVGIARLIAVPFLLVWFGVMVYWAKKSREITRWFAGGVLAFVTLLSVEAFRRKFHLGPTPDNSLWSVFLNVGFSVMVIAATLTAVWKVRREYGSPGGVGPPSKVE